MNRKVLLSLFGITFCCNSLLNLVNAEPSYTVELTAFTPAEKYDKTWIDWGSLRIKQKARNELVMTGTFNLYISLGNEQSLNVQIYKINPNTGDRGPIVFMMSKPYCEAAQENEDTYKNMAKYSNFPPEFECPLPKGEYKFDDYIVETNFLPDDTAKGDYVIAVTFKDGEQAVAGYDLDITIS